MTTGEDHFALAWQVGDFGMLDLKRICSGLRMGIACARSVPF
jgi:hypothetical protein